MSLLRVYYLPNGLMILRMCGPTLILCCLPIMWGNLIIYNLVVQQTLILLTSNCLIIWVVIIFLTTRLASCNALFFELFHCIVCLIRIWRCLFMHPDQSWDTSNELYHVNSSWKIIHAFLCLAHMQPTKYEPLSTVCDLTHWLVLLRSLHHSFLITIYQSTQLFLFVQWMVLVSGSSLNNVSSFHLLFLCLQMTAFRITNELKADIDIPLETEDEFNGFWKEYKVTRTPLKGA